MREVYVEGDTQTSITHKKAYQGWYLNNEIKQVLTHREICQE